MAQINDKYKQVIHIDKTAQGRDRFITVTQKRKNGVQWASCNTGIEKTRFLPNVTSFNHPGFTLTTFETNLIWSALTWLLSLPFAGIVLTPTTLWSAGSISADLLPYAISANIKNLTKSLKTLQYIAGTFGLTSLSQLVNFLSPYITPEFVEYTKPCSETAGIDF